MNRLTYRKRDGNYSIKFDLGNLQQVDIEANNKLGHLEDIEEELGIDLIRSVNICKKANSQKYVYTRESGGVCKLTLLDDLEVELFHHRLYSNSRGMYVSLNLKDYEKTWALDKQTLEK